MAELKAIKVRYTGKCATCGREIKEGWDAFFDSDGKKIYCTKCAKSQPSNGIPVTSTLTQEDIAELTPEIQEKLRNAGVIKPPSIEDKISQLQASIDAIEDNIVGSFKSIEDAIGMMHMQVAAIIANQKATEAEAKAKTKKEVS